MSVKEVKETIISQMLDKFGYELNAHEIRDLSEAYLFMCQAEDIESNADAKSAFGNAISAKIRESMLKSVEPEPQSVRMPDRFNNL